MAVTDVNNYTNLANISTTSTQSSTAMTEAANDTLGKDAFLRLLIAELSNQDPLNPMEDREFVAQMATFSSLEQMQNMNKTLESMAEANKFSAVQYIGKAIAFTKGEGEEAAQTVAIVNHVWFDPNGKTILDTTEGEVDLEDVEGVSEISSNA
jgi:flagellar basal-body rod modification protein FlgD